MPNPHPDTDYLARFTAPEFTSLCPVTGQPDFALLVIDYVPGPWLVESKSLKLYLHSFRNHGAFHEDCTVAIGKRLAELLEPRYLRIGGYWYPRGGIPIDVFWQTGEIAEEPVAARPGRRALPGALSGRPASGRRRRPGPRHDDDQGRDRWWPRSGRRMMQAEAHQRRRRAPGRQKNEKAWSATAEARAPGATSVTWAWKVLWSM